jgi:hypothetical protein
MFVECIIEIKWYYLKHYLDKIKFILYEIGTYLQLLLYCSINLEIINIVTIHRYLYLDYGVNQISDSEKTISVNYHFENDI